MSVNSHQNATHQQVIAALSQIVGLPLTGTGRAADMRTFQFGALRPVDRGSVGVFALHVQCPWRIDGPDGIVTGRLDLWEPAEDNAPFDENWDYEKSPNLQDARLERWLAKYEGVLVVKGVDADEFGGAAIRFGEGFVLRMFPSGTRGEDWRLFRPKTGARHLVISGGEVEREKEKSGAKVDAAILKSYVGSYRNDELMVEYKVVLQSDRLVVKSGAFPLYVLKAVDETTFQPVTDDLTTIVFQKDKDKVTGVLQKSGTKEDLFKRLAARAELPLPKDDEPAGAIKPANWPSFRGRHASGVADGQFPPATWDADARRNIRWKTRIPGLGHSCPVVWGERIFLTTAKNGADKADLKAGLYGNVDSVNDTSPHTFHVLCLDKASGKILWDEIAHKGVPKVKRHTKATHANSTCATDGKHVVACFGSEGLYCYDTSGKLLWKKELGVLESGWFYDADYQWGFGSSPIIYENMAIMQCDAGKNSFIAAYDLPSGETIWLTPRDEVSSWGTPTIVETKTGPELVTNATKFVRGYDPKTGKELWRLGKNSEITVPTPIFAHGLIFVTSGYRPVRPIYAIRMGARGDITLAKDEKSSDAIAWSTDKAGPYMPTPIVYGEHLYTCSNDGVVTCYDAKSGKRLWWERLGSDGGFTASPVAADGKLYFTSEEGQTYVLNAGAEFTLLTTNALGDPCLTTPAIADGMLFVRTQRYLFGIGLERGK